MAEPVLTKAGQEALVSILDERLPITRQEWKKKILRIVSLLMNEQGRKEAGKDLVLEASEMVIGQPYTRAIYTMRDAVGFKKLFLDRYTDIETYYAGPYPVKRWDITSTKPIKRPDEMNVIAFCASPRKGGNTDALIDEALRGAADAGAKGEKIRLRKLNIRGCLACYKCSDPGFKRLCAQRDDIYYVYQKIRDSDAVILGFPVYANRECAQLATLLDRMHCFYRDEIPITPVEEQGGKESEHRLPDFTPLEPGKRGMVIGTWGLPYVESYDYIVEKIMGSLRATSIEVVEAISAGGFVGILRGLDEKKKAIIRRFPKELEKVYQAGKSLVTG